MIGQKQKMVIGPIGFHFLRFNPLLIIKGDESENLIHPNRSEQEYLRYFSQGQLRLKYSGPRSQ